MIKRYGPSIIFGLAILSLALLVAWWSVFLERSIHERRALILAELHSRMSLTARKLGEETASPLRSGVLSRDPDFEIIPVITSPAGAPEPFSLAPRHPLLALRIRPAALEAVQKDFKSKRLMLAGETSVLALVTVLCIFFLYKMIRLERRSMMEMEEFRGRVTHEIKTPITGLKAFLQSLKNGSIRTEDMPPLLDLALRQVEVQEQLAQNLLAGAMGRRQPLKLEAVEIIPFITDYFNRHGLRFTDAEVDFEWGNIPEENEKLYVRAETTALKIIMDNLTDNALKYASPDLRLTVTPAKRDSKIWLDIRDNGPGIPADALESVFEAFKRLDSELPAPRRGAGMGLYISRELARKMGGDLLALPPHEAGGARFRLTLNTWRGKPAANPGRDIQK